MDIVDLNEVAVSRKARLYRAAVMTALCALVALTASVIGLQLVQGSTLQAMVKESRLQGRRDAVLVQVGKVRDQLDALNGRLDALEKVADDNIRRLDVIESLKK